MKRSSTIRLIFDFLGGENPGVLGERDQMAECAPGVEDLQQLTKYEPTNVTILYLIDYNLSIYEIVIKDASRSLLINIRQCIEYTLAKTPLPMMV